MTVFTLLTKWQPSSYFNFLLHISLCAHEHSSRLNIMTQSLFLGWSVCSQICTQLVIPNNWKSNIPTKSNYIWSCFYPPNGRPVTLINSSFVICSLDVTVASVWNTIWIMTIINTECIIVFTITQTNNHLCNQAYSLSKNGHKLLTVLVVSRMQKGVNSDHISDTSWITWKFAILSFPASTCLSYKTRSVNDLYFSIKLR